MQVLALICDCGYYRLDSPACQAEVSPLRRSKSVTLKDVARVANVSEATASRVLHPHNGTPPLSSATRDLVRRAAADLGYRANWLARSLSRNHTDTLGILLHVDAVRLSKPYSSLILAGIGQAASARGFSLALYY